MKELWAHVRAGGVRVRLGKDRCGEGQQCKYKCESNLHDGEPLLRFIYLTSGGVLRIQRKYKQPLDSLRLCAAGCFRFRK